MPTAKKPEDVVDISVTTAASLETQPTTLSIDPPEGFLATIGDEIDKVKEGVSDIEAGVTDITEGAALLGSVVADFGGWTRKIFAAGEHTVQALAEMPKTWEQALALPLAGADETLHEVEGLLIQSFRDVGDEIRKIYLNVHGMFVKA